MSRLIKCRCDVCGAPYYITEHQDVSADSGRCNTCDWEISELERMIVDEPGVYLVSPKAPPRKCSTWTIAAICFAVFGVILAAVIERMYL